jgi:hypothetical protein
MPKKHVTARAPRRLQSEEIQGAVSATWQVDWTEFALVPALRCLPGIALPLLLGLKFHNVGAGVMASSGALTVGFGSFYRFRWSRSAPMLLAVLGISLSAFISAIAEHTLLGFVLMACAWAYVCGLLRTLGDGIWWVSLQYVIFAMIASNFPVGFGNIVTRTLMVFGGGMLQALLIVLFWRITNGASRQGAATEDGIPFSMEAVRDSVRSFWSHLRRNLSPTTPIGRTALQLAVTVASAAAISRLLALHNGYWLPMTAVIVMNTDWRQTFTKGLGRVVGTLVGGGLATLLAVLLRPGPLELAGLVVLFAFFSFLFLRVNYGLYAIFITSYVVFQLAGVGLPTAELVPARIIATVLGGVLALVLQFVWPVDRLERIGVSGEDIENR